VPGCFDSAENRAFVERADGILNRHQRRESDSSRCACGCVVNDDADMYRHLVNMAIIVTERDLA